MKKQGITLVLLAFSLISFAQKGSLHQFKTATLEGEDFDLASLKGKKVLVVNTASKCGLTPQYADLEVLYKKYGGDKFVIIGFPANNFMKQEPGSHDEIREFCTQNYGVTFPMMEKISVKGDDMHPIYQWLTQKAQNGVMDSEVGWNFQKYMIDEDGQLVGFLKPRETVDSEKLISWLEE